MAYLYFRPTKEGMGEYIDYDAYAAKMNEWLKNQGIPVEVKTKDQPIYKDPDAWGFAGVLAAAGVIGYFLLKKLK